MTLSATYDPADNKLRLSASSRLDAELYARVKAAGFVWAPKQDLFAAPMWTPEREDLLLELCGEIDDEDTSLVDRAEERAERFEDYSNKRSQDATRAHDAVEAIAQGIPFGQPILVGHHSEAHARRDAEKIENGMRYAVRMWETAEYWERRAKGAIRAAKYKERPDVRARRIKTIEAELRKREREKAHAEKCLAFWTTPGLTHERALYAAGRTDLGHHRLPRKDGDDARISHQPSPYDVLSNCHPTLFAPRTLEEVIDAAKTAYPSMIARCDRWIAHYTNRLLYERAMLDEQGASDLLAPKVRPKQLPLCNYRADSITSPNIYHRGETITYPQVEMTQAEYARIPTDYKGTREVDHSHRIRTCMRQHQLVCVFLTDSKVHEKPAPVAPSPVDPAPRPQYKPEPPSEKEEKLDAARETLKAGVQVVSAPQLFPTPADLAARMAEELGIRPGDHVLEPSAGTGRLLEPLFNADRSDWAGEPIYRLVAVELSGNLAHALRRTYPAAEVKQCDFLEQTAETIGTFNRILMNPPFAPCAADIDHILHARSLLRPGGRMVAICANGPRQQMALEPLADVWNPLPDGTFDESGTGVRTVLLTMEAPELPDEAPTAEKDDFCLVLC